jgi:hypothetical protein
MTAPAPNTTGLADRARKSAWRSWSSKRRGFLYIALDFGFGVLGIVSVKRVP